MAKKEATNNRRTEKREGFRFCNRTVSNMDAIIQMRQARNKTEAIDIALEHLVTEEKTKQALMGELRSNGALKQLDAQTRNITSTMSMMGEKSGGLESLLEVSL